MGKVLLIVSICITAAAAALGFINKGKLTSAMQDRDAAQAEVTQKTADLEKASKELKSAKDTLTTTIAEKDQIASQAETTKAELDKTKTEVASLTSQISSKESEVAKLTADIQAKEQELTTLRSGSDTAAAAPGAEQLAKEQEQQMLITKLQGDLDGARRQLEELRTREQNRMALKMRNGLEGRVLAVNQAWNFVVLNLGDKNGVVSNAEMLVKRGNQLIGKVRVTSVEPSTAIADIVSNSVPRGLSIQPGDNVIYQAVEE